MNYQAFYYACTHGDLVQVKTYPLQLLTRDFIGINDNRLFRITCYNGHFELAKWLYETCNVLQEDAKSDENHAFRFACFFGNLEIAEWLVKTFELSLNDVQDHNNFAFHWACFNMKLDVIKWLIQNYLQLCVKPAKIFWEGLIKESCKTHNEFMVLWLTNTFPSKIAPDEYKDYVQDMKDNDGIMVKPAV